MATVVITCPKTGKEVETGDDFDAETFKNMILENNHLQCSACGEIHTWSKKDAKLKK